MYAMLISSLALALSACAFSDRITCPGNGNSSIQDTLYFGTAKPGGHVTADQWTGFLNSSVSPRFPEGFTTWNASGQWRSAQGQIIREPTLVLNIIHPDNEASSRSIQEIMQNYSYRFHQEAVLRLTSRVCESY